MLLSARVLPVEEFFQLGTFGAASVQRDYIWDTQESEDLLADVERACAAYYPEPEVAGGPRISVVAAAVEDEGRDDPASAPTGKDGVPGYHLGPVVLRAAGGRAFEIFDGLQRATTLTILLCVLRDLTASEALRERIGALIHDGAAVRLTFPGADRTLYAEIQTGNQAIRSFRRAVSARGERLRRSRAVFHRYLGHWDQDRLSRFSDFLLARTYFVVTETESEAMARQVFITANGRGVLLRPIDIFKGQLLDIAGSGEAGEQAARRWQGILHVAGDGIEDFMRAYDFAKRCEPQGADHLAKLAAHIEKHHGASRLEAVLDEILRHASAWMWLLEKLKSAPATPADMDIWRLRFFKWFEWRPVALAWYHEYNEKRGQKAGGAGTKAETAFKQRFAALHRICMMMTLAKFSANDRARIFGKALSQKRNPFSTNSLRPGALTFWPQQVVRIQESLATPLYDDEIRLPLMRWLEFHGGRLQRGRRRRLCVRGACAAATARAKLAMAQGFPRRRGALFRLPFHRQSRADGLYRKPENHQSRFPPEAAGHQGAGEEISDAGQYRRQELLDARRYPRARRHDDRFGLRAPQHPALPAPVIAKI